MLPLHQRPMWQGRLDLNQRRASQSRMCYHYTTPLYIWFNIILLLAEGTGLEPVHPFLDEWISNPLQYQLCLTLQMVYPPGLEPGALRLKV